jgi:Calpain family cysteine protease
VTSLLNGNFATLSIAATSRLQPSDITTLTVAQTGALTATQFAVLSPADLKAFSAVQIAAVSLTAIQGLSARQLGNLTTSELSEFTAAQIGALTTGQLASLSKADILAVTGAHGDVLTRSQIQSLSSGGVQTLSATQIQGFGAAQLAALNASFLNSTQIAGLDATTIGNLSVAQFGASVAKNLAAVTTDALSGITLAQYQSLTTSQLASLSTAQNAALAAPVLAEAYIAQYAARGTITYTGMLSLLQTAATGGMTTAKFGALQDIANDLNVKGGLTTSAYVEQITDDVVEGDSANANWNGGSSFATALGDLTANSTAPQANELIGKWFLGTDLPGAAGGASAYQATALSLYGPSGAPIADDVNQGDLGDGYLLSSLADVAAQNPSAIESMISSNGNGTYSVDFDVNGEDDYVTVNGQLPVLASNAELANSSDLEYANGSTSWAPLIEKAYAELNEQSGVPSNGTAEGENSYSAIAGGLAYPLTEITGQSTSSWSLAGMSTSAQSSLTSTLAATFAANGEVLLSSASQSQGDLVAGQMFEVTGIDASTGTLTIQNPSTPVDQNGVATSFTETITQLAAYNASLYTSSPPTPPVVTPAPPATT